MRTRLLLSLGIVTLTGWLLGTFWAETSQQSTVDSYRADFRGGQWISAADSSARTYFRMSFATQSQPESVTLWIDAQQTFSAWVNGHSIGNDNGTFRTGTAPVGVVFDVTQDVVVGNNSVAVQVTNRDSSVAAMIGRVTVVTDGQAVNYVTAPTLWRATSNVGLVNPPPITSTAGFTTAKFDDSQWGPAQAVHAVRATTLAPVPSDIMDGTLRAQVLAAPHFGRDLIVSTAVYVPGAPTDAWLRVAASGPFSLFLDGRLLTSRLEPLAPVGVATNARSVVLTLINLDGFVHSGRNVIAVHVTANPMAAAYADGRINTASGIVSIATGDTWGAAGPPFGDAVSQPPSTTGTDLGPPVSVWTQGVIRTPATAQSLGLPTGLSPLGRLLVIAAVLAAWLLTGGVAARLGRVPFASGLVADAIGHIPGGFAIAALEQVGRMANIPPPFPQIPLVLLIVVVVIVAGKLAAAIGVATRRPVIAAPSPPAAATARADAVQLAAQAPAGAPVPPVRYQRRTLGARLGGAVEASAAQVRAHPWHAAGVAAIAAVLGGLAAYNLSYQPVWQDELASLGAAQGIRAHGLPMLPSSFVYWKGELYSVLLAAVGAVTGDNVVSLRAISVFWYVATIIAFALLLAPVVLPRRRRLQLALTLLFASAPAELLWSRDIRMYQMAQFFFIIFLALFIRAMQRPQLRTIAGSAIALVVMYLSHEETFVFLPAIPIIFLAVMRLRWVRDWRWWVFGLGAFAIIGGQYVLASISHPPYFGFDSSNKPFIQYDPSNSYYYLNTVYFSPVTTLGSLAFVSTLAVIGGVVGFVRRSLPRMYLSAFILVAVICLSVVFSPKVARYTFVTLPALFALAGAGAVDLIDALRRFLGAHPWTARERPMLQKLITIGLIPAFIWLGLTQATGMRDYGLAVARLTGAPMAETHTDYGVVAGYVKAHEQPGDILVTLAPPNVVAYYVGRAPDYEIATSRNRLLYLMEINGKAVDTTFGAEAILTAGDLQLVMNAHHRIWIVTDQGTYMNSVNSDVVQLIRTQFSEVAEGATSAAYFRDA
jgi:hypothetical protein